MRLLLDNGLPRSAALMLNANGHDAVHVGDLSMSSAADQVILEVARRDQRVVVTLDADFHTLLALSAAADPSVIRVRIEGLKGPELASVVERVLRSFAIELQSGAAISVGSKTVRCHRLPLR